MGGFDTRPFLRYKKPELQNHHGLDDVILALFVDVVGFLYVVELHEMGCHLAWVPPSTVLKLNHVLAVLQPFEVRDSGWKPYWHDAMHQEITLRTHGISEE